MAYSSTAMPKALLLYTGPSSDNVYVDYPTYTNNDLDQLFLATKEFVICTGNVCYNYDISGNQIITSSLIEAITSADIQYANTLSNVKNDYHSMLNNIQYVCTLAANISNQIDLADKIIDRDSNAVIWFSFPHIPFEACAQHYTTPFTAMVNNIKSQIGTTRWNNNIRGFYWGTEQVNAYYTKFDASSVNYAFNNRHVKLMKDMSDLIHGYGKQFMWIPYLTTDTSTSPAYSIIRTGYVANKTNIFNYVLVQPGYYSHAEKLAQLNLAKTCAQNNKLYNNSGGVTGGTKTSSTKIGVEMEIDSNITGTNWQGYNDRYYEYTLRFNPLKTNIPVCYYAGDKNSTMNSTVKGYITTFYNY